MNLGQIKTRIQKQQFLFEELVKRDFKRKYKRTILGMLWSMLSPLLMLGVMSFVFTRFFGRTIPHYPLYILAGQIVFAFYSEATNQGMIALVADAGIFSKINVPKYLFVLSRNISALLNFSLTLVIFFVFVFVHGIEPHLSMLAVLWPILWLALFNFGIGLLLSALYLFFRDLQYLYSLLLQMIMYGSAIFYSIDQMSEEMQMVFYCNPLYVYITCIREAVIYETPLTPLFFIFCPVFAILALGLGLGLYKKFNFYFIYYI